MTVIHRGDVWIVNLDPVVGAEIRKTRPVLVISNDIANQHAQTVTVVPFTDAGSKVYPFEVEVPAKIVALTKASKIKCQQIRTVDKSRLVQFQGVLPEVYLHQAERALCLHLGLDPATHL